MTGMYLGPCPPHLCIDLLGAIVASLLAQTAGEAETVLVLDSELGLHDDACAMSFLLLPSAGGVSDLLAPLGLAS
jgi:chemotaxis protein CheC